jgi:hypothetical protein
MKCGICIGLRIQEIFDCLTLRILELHMYYCNFFCTH